MAEERCWNCDRELHAGDRFCNACGSPALDPAPPGPGAAPGGAPGSGPGPASGPQRYYASRYLSDPTVYVQEQGFWRRVGPGGVSGGAGGEIPAIDPLAAGGDRPGPGAADGGRTGVGVRGRPP